MPVLRNLLEAKKMWSGSITANCASPQLRRWSRSIPATAARSWPKAGWSRESWRLLRSMPRRLVLGYGSGAMNASCCAETISATISSSWGKSSILIRELSLGGGMGTKEDNLRVGSEANIEIAVESATCAAQVLLRRARVNEVGFEIVNTDLESRYRLRRILMDSLDNSSGTTEGEWDGQRGDKPM